MSECADDNLHNHGFHVLKRFFVEEDGEKFGRFYKVYNEFGQIGYFDVDIEEGVKNCSCDIVLSSASFDSNDAEVYLQGTYKIVQPEASGVIIEEYDSHNHELTGLSLMSHGAGSKGKEHFQVSNSSLSTNKQHSLSYPLFRYSDLQKHPESVRQSLIKVSKRLEMANLKNNAVVLSDAEVAVSSLNQSFNKYANDAKALLMKIASDKKDLLTYKEIYQKQGTLSPAEYAKYLQIPTELKRLNAQEARAIHQITTISHELQKLLNITTLVEKSRTHL